jgi:ketosteroid isomerase-like protein
MRLSTSQSLYGRAVEDLEFVERELLDALRRADRTALDALLRDDFVITTAGWLSEPVGKQAWLEAALGEHVLERFDLRLTATRRYGDVAVVLAESSQEGTRDGEAWSLTFRYTDVWVLGEAWRLAARHASVVPAR